MATEEPRYEVIEKSGDIELRAYAPMIIAEAVVEGTLDDASSQGFRLIADYIFGGNIAKSGAPGEKIAMTAPVTVEPQSQKIAMTAPVTVEPKEGADNKSWRVRFVMPATYTLATLPTPKNPRITLREVPAQKSAVIVYSGFNGAEKLKQKTAFLQSWMNDRKLVASSAAQLARYDPPWTLPFMRRNELMINYR